MKYSKAYERDFRWYLKMRHRFNFDGVAMYLNKLGKPIVNGERFGVDGKFAFYRYDSNGEILPTRHPRLLRSLLRTKGSVNLHIKMYGEDRATGIFPGIEFMAYAKDIEAPEWFIEAVEHQKIKNWDNCDFHSGSLKRSYEVS